MPLFCRLIRGSTPRPTWLLFNWSFSAARARGCAGERRQMEEDCCRPPLFCARRPGYKLPFWFDSPGVLFSEIPQQLDQPRTDLVRAITTSCILHAR